MTQILYMKKINASTNLGRMRVVASLARRGPGANAFRLRERFGTVVAITGEVASRAVLGEDFAASGSRPVRKTNRINFHGTHGWTNLCCNTYCIAGTLVFRAWYCLRFPGAADLSICRRLSREDSRELSLGDFLASSSMTLCQTVCLERRVAKLKVSCLTKDNG